MQRQMEPGTDRIIIDPTTTTEDNVHFYGANAYIDRDDAIELFAYIGKDRPVNGVVPVRVPRAVLEAYLANWK